MKKYLRITLFLLSSSIFILTLSKTILASEIDFIIDTKTEISYTTGEETVVVKTEYIRSVKNGTFYFPATGEKTFHIPDITSSSKEMTTEERKNKLETLKVTDNKGNKVKHSVKEQELGEGIYITVPNYKATTASSPYHIILEYRSSDYIVKVGDFINIVGTSLPEDTIFEKKDEKSGTLTAFNYYFTIVVDENISPLTKAFPNFNKEKIGNREYYSFNQTERIANSPSLEFGTEAVYRFELTYATPQTDNFIPEKYSSVFRALSTNVYELSLPREFSETNQKVYFEKMTPIPKDIFKDSEGNILAMFEVPANQKSEIKIEGYILVQQEEIKENREYYDMNFLEYQEKITESSHLKKYLGATKYWQSKDQYIKQEAEKLMKDRETLLDIVKANYQYINENLEYNPEKATSENERIGAKKALEGGPSVCMEYADLMIALLRAQGIPSRAAIGYANLKETIPEDQVRHQWVQIWIPEYGWLSVDPTFESRNMKIGQMIDRILWEVFNHDSLSNIRVYSANTVVDLTTEEFEVKVYGVSEEINLSTLKIYTDFIDKEEVREESDPSITSFVGTVLKTTTLGKAMLITIPIIFVLGSLITIISIISFFIKKQRRKRREKRQEKRKKGVTI